MKKLPKIYQNELNKINNNKTVFDSLKEIKEKANKVNNKKINNNSNILTVKEKIKELTQKNNYIFNTKIKLIFNDHEKETSIAGIVNNYIITMDNEIINIDTIKDIIVS